MSDNAADLPAAAAALSAEDRAGLVNALKSEHDELETKFLEERAQLQAKYQKLYEPLYTKSGSKAQPGKDKGTEHPPDCKQQ
ncbi:hypothetical protein TSUD_111550 [Trifolium subterraneum]|uniref:Uncharacterized protein n=1 Tax=Trifolium subterraneum TaxID=3900 RepID=A0A2Z6MG94_TRISU|nr:hypothetical protein TSUD_111550 [Trifolium subterraneum]